METFRIFLPASSLQIGLVHLCSFLNTIPVGFDVCTPVLYQCPVSLCENSFDCLYSHLFTTIHTSLSDQKVFPWAFLSGPWNGTMPCLPMFHAGSSGLSFHLQWLCALGSCHIVVYVITEFYDRHPLVRVAYACDCLTSLLVFQWQRRAHVASLYCSILWYMSYVIWWRLPTFQTNIWPPFSG